MKRTLPASKSRLVQSLASASGALAATVASTQAATVQITLTGNNLTSSTNSLNADYTGDGLADCTLKYLIRRSDLVQAAFAGPGGTIIATARYNSSVYGVHAGNESHGVGVNSIYRAPSPQNIKYLSHVTFSDARINSGVATQGFLEVNSFNTSSTFQTIALTRVVFDDASTTLAITGLSTGTNYTEFVAAPEPSSFGLLALGAGGLLARRRRQAA